MSRGREKINQYKGNKTGKSSDLKKQNHLHNKRKKRSCDCGNRSEKVKRRVGNFQGKGEWEVCIWGLGTIHAGGVPRGWNGAMCAGSSSKRGENNTRADYSGVSKGGKV